MAEFSDAEIERLGILWKEGHSTVEIGRRMLRSKNSIVGKAHRLELPERPSPIIRDGRTPAPRRPRAAIHTLPPMEGAMPTEPPQDAPVVRLDPRRGCQWMEGTRRPWVACNEPVVVGRSWCPLHYAKVF